MEIYAEDKNWNTWVEEGGWKLSYSFAMPRLTKKGHVGCRWQTTQEFTYPNKDVAHSYYESNLAFLESRYQKKEIAHYQISLMHLTRLKTRCPVCGGDADILTFMICLGGADRPSTSIVCEHCVNPGQHPIENQVGIYYFLPDTSDFSNDPDEKSFSRLQYIIKKEDLKNV